MKKFEILNLTFVENMGRRFAKLKTLNKTRPFFAKLRSVHFTILFHPLLFKSN